jgi:Transposase DDE domain
MRERTFGEKLSERMWKMEGLFAEAKQKHSLSYAKYRGRPKVQNQAYLSAIMQKPRTFGSVCKCSAYA